MRGKRGNRRPILGDEAKTSHRVQGKEGEGGFYFVGRRPGKRTDRRNMFLGEKEGEPGKPWEREKELIVKKTSPQTNAYYL